MSNKGYPIEGRREDLESDDVKLISKHNTFTQLGVNKYGQDIFPFGVYEAQALVAAEAGSTSSKIVVTGHSIKKGDVIEFVTTANPLQESFAQVWTVIDANTIQLAGDLSAAVSTGDTFNVLRPTYQRLAPNGATLATVSSGPIRIQRGASGSYAPTEITKDTAVSGNTIPMPVEIVSSSGTEINITAGDLNVQLSASGVNYDSTRIGDGTNELGINASNEALVKDADVETAVQAVGTQLPSVIGQNAAVDSLSVVLASDQGAIDVNNISGTVSLPTGASTASKQDDTILAIRDVESEVGLTLLELINLNTTDFATETTLASINTKTPSLGQSNEAGSVPVALTTAQASNLADVDTATTALAAQIGVGGLQVALTDIATLATESTLAAAAVDLAAIEVLNTNILAALGNQQVEKSVTDFTRVDFSTTSVSNSAYTTIVASSSGIFKAARFFYAGGQPLLLAIGGTSSEVDEFMIPPGADFEINLKEIPASSRISLKAVNAVTISSGQLIINWLG